MKRNFIFLVFDIVFVVLSFLFLVWLKDSSKTIIKTYSEPFLIFLFVWLVTSLITRKYAFSRFRSLKSISGTILVSNLSVIAIIAIMMFSFNQFEYSRVLVFGTVIITTFIEIVGAAMLNLIIKTPVIEHENGNTSQQAGLHDYRTLKKRQRKERDTNYPAKDFKKITELLLRIIEEENGSDVRALIEKFSGMSPGKIKVVSTTTRFNILSLSQESYGCLINLQRINDFQYINKFFEAVNQKLTKQGIFIGKAETFSLRKNHILSSYPFPFNYLIYMVDFVFKRIFPKIPGLKKMYFWFTRGRNRLVSRAETLGRLYSCGFEVLDEQFLNGELYFVARKTGEPLYPQSPTYGPLIKLNRVGKHGKMFRVYKMRTMHPFAEYLQPYIYKKYSLQTGGKFKDDFRVSTLGRIMRKVWIDELPMLINIFRGNMKIVGVRPLSKHYFSLYHKELQEKRTKFKPGLIPPFYADLPETLDEIMASEMKYLEAYEKSPLKTDMKYFLAAWKNIIFKRARSN